MDTSFLLVFFLFYFVDSLFHRETSQFGNLVSSFWFSVWSFKTFRFSITCIAVSTLVRKSANLLRPW